MTGLFDRLAQRVAGTEAVAAPRLATTFEPVAPAEAPAAIERVAPPVSRSAAPAEPPPAPRPTASPASQVASDERPAPTSGTPAEPGLVVRETRSTIRAEPALPPRAAVQPLPIASPFAQRTATPPSEPPPNARREPDRAPEPTRAQAPAAAQPVVTRHIVNQRIELHHTATLDRASQRGAQPAPANPVAPRPAAAVAPASIQAVKAPLLNAPTRAVAPQRVRRADAAAPVTAEPTPVIVRIDRIDVRVTPPPAPILSTRRSEPSANPAPRLEDFLARGGQ